MRARPSDGVELVPTTEDCDAVSRFRVQRRVTLLLVLAAATALNYGVLRGDREASFVAFLACLVAAVAVAVEARMQLLSTLARGAVTRHRMQPHEARAHARAVLRLLLLPPISTRLSKDGLPSENIPMLPTITITTLDRQRLGSLLSEGWIRDESALERLDQELARATVIASDSAPDDLVTMNSRVRYVDELAGVDREITLVYPHDANRDDSRVSVLSPIGSALLGLRVGQAIDWPIGSGPPRRFRVLALPYQPESSGHYHL